MERKNYALIPAYQPDEKLIQLCRRLTEESYTVIVVDDGSGPAYAPILQAAESFVTLLTHPENKGKGAALKTGMNYIAGIGGADDFVVTADADGQHRPEDIAKTLLAAGENPSALTLGSRAFTGKVLLKSRMGNAITRNVFALLAHRRVRDTQTGLRAFSCQMIPFLLSVQGERYEYEMNVLLACARQNVPIREVPIETVYIDGNASSHFRPFQDAWRIYREIFAFAASSFVGFLVDYGLFSALAALMGNGLLPLCNILARLVSASVNYTINRRYVFRDQGRVSRSAPRYALLALGILCANTLILMLLVDALHLNRYVAKLTTELILFVVSWAVQKFGVFSRQSPQP